MSKTKASSVPHFILKVGDLIYLHCNRNKSYARHRYLDTSCDGKWCYNYMFVRSPLRSTLYHVKQTDCYKVPVFIHDVYRSKFANVDHNALSQPGIEIVSKRQYTAYTSYTRNSCHYIHSSWSVTVHKH